MIQPLWRTVWRFLKKLKIELPYDPAIPLLGIYPEKTIIQKQREGGQQTPGYHPPPPPPPPPRLIRHTALPKGPDLKIFDGKKKEDKFAFDLHIDCVNSRPGHVRALESPWLLLPPLWFPHLPESLLVASCVATAG